MRSTWARFSRTRSAQAASSWAAVAVLIASRYVGAGGIGLGRAIVTALRLGRGRRQPTQVRRGVDVRIGARDGDLPDELRVGREDRAEPAIPGELVGEAPHRPPDEDGVRRAVSGVS